MKRALLQIYRRLHAHFGPSGWWPGDTPFEIAIGAILTQNTAWSNVEKAIANLERARLLHPRRLLECPDSRIEEALRPSGYFRVKSRRVRGFCEYLMEVHGGSMTRMARQPLEILRPQLLQVHGIGPETADDILLYACRKPVFVVDAYTRRILSRHGLVAPGTDYESLRATFERNLPPDVDLFKDNHGLLVMTGNQFCRPAPRCEKCPLRPMLRCGEPKL